MECRIAKLLNDSAHKSLRIQDNGVDINRNEYIVRVVWQRDSSSISREWRRDKIMV
jgi:hypothetical protein